MAIFMNETSKHCDADMIPVMWRRWFANAVDSLDDEMIQLSKLGVVSETEKSMEETIPPYEVRLMLDIVRDKISTWANEILDSMEKDAKEELEKH